MTKYIANYWLRVTTFIIGVFEVVIFLHNFNTHYLPLLIQTEHAFILECVNTQSENETRMLVKVTQKVKINDKLDFLDYFGNIMSRT